MSRWKLAAPFARVQSHPSIARVVRSPQCALSLVNPITVVPLQGSIPVRVPSRGRGYSSEAGLGVTVRGIVTSALIVSQVANPIPSVPLGLLRVSLWCSRGLLCCLHTSSPVSARSSCKAVVHLSHLIKLQCKTSTII
jgi:hypothetical protein